MHVQNENLLFSYFSITQCLCRLFSQVEKMVYNPTWIEVDGEDGKLTLDVDCIIGKGGQGDGEQKQDDRVQPDLLLRS